MVVSVLAALATLPATLGQATCWEEGVEYHGGGLDNPMVDSVVSVWRCQELCQERQGCNYFTWVSQSHDVAGYRETCWLKGSQGNPQPGQGMVSGPRDCPDNPTPGYCCNQVAIISSGGTQDYQGQRLGHYML